MCLPELSHAQIGIHQQLRQEGAGLKGRPGGRLPECLTKPNSHWGFGVPYHAGTRDPQHGRRFRRRLSKRAAPHGFVRAAAGFQRGEWGEWIQKICHVLNCADIGEISSIYVLGTSCSSLGYKSTQGFGPFDFEATWLWAKIGDIPIWLVVLIILKNISQWEGLSHILWKIKNVWNHQPATYGRVNMLRGPMMINHNSVGDENSALIVVTTSSGFAILQA